MKYYIFLCIDKVEVTEKDLYYFDALTNLFDLLGKFFSAWI